LHDLRDALSFDAGSDDDERHPHLLFVHRAAVVAAAVIPELLAMIGAHDGDGAGSALFHERDQLAQHGVGGSDLGVVAIHVAIAEIEAWVQFVGLVRSE
jgi:hypothetical protein